MDLDFRIEDQSLLDDIAAKRSDVGGVHRIDRLEAYPTLLD